MGNNVSKNQEDIKFYLSKNYKTERYPNIVHRVTNQNCIVQQIVTNSSQESQKITNDVVTYRNSQCQSVQKLLEYLPIDSDKICSEQEYHYIVYEGQDTYNLNEQYLTRKYYKQKFTDNEIIQILSTYLCGLRQYENKFNRKIQNTDFESISINEQTLQLRLKDPLVDHRDYLFKKNKKQGNEAPQIKQRKQSFINSQKQYNKFLTNLYNVGLLGLQLYKMQAQNQQTVNYFVNININANNFPQNKDKELLATLSTIRNIHLKNGIQTLLKANPQQRSNIFNIWKIESQQKYKLERHYKNGKNYASLSQSIELLPTSSGFQSSKYKTTNQNNNLNVTGNNSTNATTYPGYNNLQLNPSNSRFNSNSFSFNHSNIFKKSTDVNSNIVNQTTVQTSKINQPFHIFQASNYNVNNDYSSIYNKPYQFSKSGFTKVSNSNQYSSSFAQKQPKFNFPQSGNQNSKPFSYLTSQKIYSNPNNITKFNGEQIGKLPTTTSFLYNEKPSLAGLQNMAKSPYSQKDLKESSYHALFNKYSHLNLQATPGNAQRKHIQNQMGNLLNSPYGNRKIQTKQNENIKKQQEEPNYFIGFQRQLGMVRNQQNKFQTKKGYSPYQRIKDQKQQTPFVPTYALNSQVQQILKRLGINELTYKQKVEMSAPLNINTHQSNGYIYNQAEYVIGSNNQQQKNRQFLPQLKLQHQNSDHSVKSIIQKVKQSQLDTFNNKKQINGESGVVLSKIQKQSLSPPSSIEDRLTTPIRPIVRNKYNSTIVQVGDEDSPSEGNQPHHFQPIQEDYVVEEYQTGSKYQGYKHNGMRNGRGKFYYQDGGYYEGMWRDNKMDGWGKLYYEGGKLAYQGNWKQDQFHGYGKVFNDNPTNLSCGFDFTNFDQLEDYWEYYEGMLVQDTKQGRGKIKLCNGQIFEGDFHKDRIQGFGKFTTMQDNTIEGIWRDSKLIKIINS